MEADHALGGCALGREGLVLVRVDGRVLEDVGERDEVVGRRRVVGRHAAIALPVRIIGEGPAHDGHRLRRLVVLHERGGEAEVRADVARIVVDDLLVVAHGVLLVAGAGLHAREFGAHEGLVELVALLGGTHRLLQRPLRVVEVALRGVGATEGVEGRRIRRVGGAGPLTEGDGAVEVAKGRLHEGRVGEHGEEEIAGGPLVLLEHLLQLGVGDLLGLGAALDLVRDLRAQQPRLDVLVLGVEKLREGLQGGVGVAEIELELGHLLERADVGGVAHEAGLEHLAGLLEGAEPTLGRALERIRRAQVRLPGPHLALHDRERVPRRAVEVAAGEQHQGVDVVGGEFLRPLEQALGVVDVAKHELQRGLGADQLGVVGLLLQAELDRLARQRRALEVGASRRQAREVLGPGGDGGDVADVEEQGLAQLVVGLAVAGGGVELHLLAAFDEVLLGSALDVGKLALPDRTRPPQRIHPGLGLLLEQLGHELERAEDAAHADDDGDDGGDGRLRQRQPARGPGAGDARLLGGDGAVAEGDLEGAMLARGLQALAGWRAEVIGLDPARLDAVAQLGHFDEFLAVGGPQHPLAGTGGRIDDDGRSRRHRRRRRLPRRRATERIRGLTTAGAADGGERIARW
jgi:hypothetical protein